MHAATTAWQAHRTTHPLIVGHLTALATAVHKRTTKGAQLGTLWRTNAGRSVGQWGSCPRNTLGAVVAAAGARTTALRASGYGGEGKRGGRSQTARWVHGSTNSEQLWQLQGLPTAPWQSVLHVGRDAKLCVIIVGANVADVGRAYVGYHASRTLVQTPCETMHCALL